MLRTALTRVPVAVEHIGSTSVPGLAAKPVIDIMVAVPELSLDSPETGAVTSLGYECFGEAGVPGRLYFRKRGELSFNVHLTRAGGDIWEGNLLIRDFLRSHPAEASAYAAMKLAAAREAPSLLAYSERKAPFIAQIIERAKQCRLSTPERS